MTWEGTHDIETTDHIEDNAPETLLQPQVFDLPAAPGPPPVGRPVADLTARSLLKPLGGREECIRPDLPGTGGSERPTSGEPTNLGLIFCGYSVSFNCMLKMLLIGFLALLLLCMVPLMGSISHSGGHLHHDASVSCASCMGSIDLPLAIFLLTFLGSVTFMLVLSSPVVPSRSPFHPPRFSS